MIQMALFEMRKQISLLFLVFASAWPACAAPANSPSLSLAGQRVLWLGDSITADGKYVTDVEYYLNRQFPDAKFDLVSIGLSSETVSGLSEKQHPFPRPCVLERLQRALDQVKPQVVVACYGMNDGIYHPLGEERSRAFRAGIEKLIAAAKVAGAQVILLTPPPFDPLPIHARLRPGGAADYSYVTPFEKYDEVLADYARWELTLSPATAMIVDLHTPLAEETARRRVNNPNFTFSGDGIHPSAEGHLLMALTILKALGVTVKAPDLETEVVRLQADPLFALVSRHRETRSRGWLPFVGYTRGEAIKTTSVEAAETSARALARQIDPLRKP